MTVNTADNIAPTTTVQEKVDTTLPQEKVEANAAQKPAENKEPESPEDPNWRAFREARKKDRSEREAAEKRAHEKEQEVAALKAAMEAAFAKGPPVSYSQGQQGYQSDYPVEETEDERIEKKVTAAIAQREQQNEQARIAREQAEYPQRLVQSYPDFHHIITAENMDYLEFHHPETARPLKRLGDNFDKWSDIYHAIKKYVPNSTGAKKEAARADANFNKPRSMSSASPTQNTGEAVSQRLTEEKRAENWARMQRTLKGVS